MTDYSKSRRSNLRVGNYRSLRQMYLDLKPEITYLAFYKRVKGGMDPYEAARLPRQKGGRPRKRKLMWEGVDY